MRLGYHSQLCSSTIIDQVVHPTLPYIGKPLMIHLNKTKEGRWPGMTFIPQFHNIYCLSFHLKHERMNYIIDNFKSSNIMGVTNMIVEKIRNVPICTKKILSKCRDRLWITYKYLRDLTLWIASQVQDLWLDFRKNFFLEDLYDRGVPYLSLLEAWINKSYQVDASLWHQFQVF